MKRTATWICNVMAVIGLFGMLAGMPACKKNGPVIALPADTGYASRIAYLLEYNPAQFQGYYSNLVQLGLQDTLAGKGPFTVFAYNSQTYGDTGFVNKSVIRGLYRLSDLEPGQTEIIDRADGFKWIITANILAGQVQYTVNGAPIVLTDQPASNGLIDVLTGVYPSTYYASCLAAIESNENYIDFSYALQRTHLDTLLADTTLSYTVFVPGGMGGLSAVRNANLDSLTNVVKNLIVPGRIFSSLLQLQYSLTDGMVNDTLSITALNGENIQLILTPPPFSYGNIGIMGQGDMTAQQVYILDLSAGLGVIQNINNPLTP